MVADGWEVVPVDAVGQIVGTLCVAGLVGLSLYMVWWGFRELRRDRSRWWRGVLVWLLAWYVLAALVGLALPHINRGP